MHVKYLYRSETALYHSEELVSTFIKQSVCFCIQGRSQLVTTLTESRGPGPWGGPGAPKRKGQKKEKEEKRKKEADRS